MKESDSASGARRRRAALQALVPAAVAAFCFRSGRIVLAVACSAIAVLLFVSGFFLPSVFERIERLGRALGQGAGILISWICLVPVFYIVFGAGRLFLWISGRDPMRRKFPTQDRSYWVVRKPVADPRDYLRQY